MTFAPRTSASPRNVLHESVRDGYHGESGFVEQHLGCFGDFIELGPSKDRVSNRQRRTALLLRVAASSSLIFAACGGHRIPGSAVEPLPECHRAPGAVVAPGASSVDGAGPPSTLPLAPRPPAAVAQAPIRDVRVTAVLPPSTVVLDGELSEWGVLPEGQEVPQLVLAIGSEQFSVAISLPESMADGVWMGLRTKPAVLPRPYTYALFGYTIAAEDRDCLFQTVCCPDGGTLFTDELRPPAETSLCRAQLSAFEELEAGLAQRYVRRFRLDASGVWELRESKELALLQEAELGWTPTYGGVTGEVSLPMGALPRLSTPALKELEVWADSVVVPAEQAEGHRTTVTLPSVVRFPPHAELRENLMNLQGIPNSALFYDGFTYDVFGISYQPGRSQEFEILKHRSLMEVYPVTLPLYRRTSSVGPYDLGVVPEPVRMLEISKDGQTEGVFPWGADQQQVFLLDGHLIVLSYTHPEYWFMCGCLPPPRLTLVVLEGNGLWRPANEPKVFEDLWSRGCTVHGAAVHREDLFRATLTSNATRDTWTWTGTCPQEDASGLTALPKSVVLRWHPERRFFDAVAQ